MILLIDNYDSFSYNLFQMVGAMSPDIQVIRNRQYTVEEVLGMSPERIILSPGPGRPADAGICEALIKEITEKELHIPVLGVCLGHQGICEALGGEIRLADELKHGKKDLIRITADCLLFGGLPEEIEAARYHSLIAGRENLPAVLEVTALSRAGEIMGVQHRKLPIFGLQFHPESILTPQGNVILRNFLNI